MQGRWYAEAAFNGLERMEELTFGTLDEVAEWVRVGLVDLEGCDVSLVGQHARGNTQKTFAICNSDHPPHNARGGPVGNRHAKKEKAGSTSGPAFGGRNGARNLRVGGYFPAKPFPLSRL